MANEQLTIPDDDLLPEERELMNTKPTTAAAVETGLDEEPAAAVVATDVTEATAAAEADPAAAAAASAAETPPTAEALAEIAADEATVAAPAPAPQFRVASSEAIEADMQALETEKAEAFQKVMSGDMEAAEYSKLEAATNRKIGKLQAQITLAEANAQTAAQAEASTVFALMDRSQRTGQLDYRADVTAQKQFDLALLMAEADPENAGKSFADLCETAHSAVLAMRGIAKAAAVTAAPAVAAVVAAPAAPAAPKPRDIPQTLVNLPAAAAVPVGNDFMTQFNAITDPDEADALLASMPKAQRQALMRSTMPH
jgi:SWI/SNF-related matrix-associated actin-dependent regulator 1 of chromatin subfamily A